MPRFLILKLDGVMQGWGGHTYEDWRPSELFPTRSGLLGLLGACIGIDRQAVDQFNNLASSILITVRVDYRIDSNGKQLKPIRKCDYHTIENARKVDGKPNKNPVQSYRWYLFDAPFTVILEEMKNATISLDQIASAIRKPVYTPFLGRRSCPLNRPLLDNDSNNSGKPFEAESILKALEYADLGGSLIYSESPGLKTDKKLRIRDVPYYGCIRKFFAREVCIYHNKEGKSVSQ